MSRVYQPAASPFGHFCGSLSADGRGFAKHRPASRRFGSRNSGLVRPNFKTRPAPPCSGRARADTIALQSGAPFALSSAFHGGVDGKSCGPSNRPRWSGAKSPYSLHFAVPTSPSSAARLGYRTATVGGFCARTLSRRAISEHNRTTSCS